MMKQGTEDTLPKKKDKKIYKSRDTPLAIACVLLLYLLVFLPLVFLPAVSRTSEL